MLLTRIQELEADIRQKDRTITGIQHYMKIAADYKNDDPAQVLAAIQAALGKAAEYQGRKQNSNKRGR